MLCNLKVFSYMNFKFANVSQEFRIRKPLGLYFIHTYVDFHFLVCMVVNLLAGQDEAKSESSESLGSAVEALQKRLQVINRACLF